MSYLPNIAAQIKDAGNSISCPPTAMPTIALPWKGVSMKTLDPGIVGTTFVIVGTPGRGGTVIFNYNATGLQAPANYGVRVPLHITDLGNPLLVPLQNVDNYFWLEFVPDDNLGTSLVISTVHQTQAPPHLVRFLSQVITDNEAVDQTRTFISARKSDGTWPPVSFGQQLMAASLPFALAIDQSTLPTSHVADLYAHLAAIGTTVVKSGAGELRRVVINKFTGGTVTATLYDGLTVLAPVIASVTIGIGSGISPTTLEYGLKFTTGLTVGIVGGAPDLTVIYK